MCTHFGACCLVFIYKLTCSKSVLKVSVGNVGPVPRMKMFVLEYNSARISIADDINYDGERETVCMFHVSSMSLRQDEMNIICTANVNREHLLFQIRDLRRH